MLMSGLMNSSPDAVRVANCWFPMPPGMAAAIWPFTMLGAAGVPAAAWATASRYALASGESGGIENALNRPRRASTRTTSKSFPYSCTDTARQLPTFPLGQWAGDGLLAVFFFIAGLELKRAPMRSAFTAAAPELVVV